MKTNDWSIIFCTECAEPTPPCCGMMTDHMGFICDDCLNHEMEKYEHEFARIVKDATR